MQEQECNESLTTRKSADKQEILVTNLSQWQIKLGFA